MPQSFAAILAGLNLLLIALAGLATGLIASVLLRFRLSFKSSALDGGIAIICSIIGAAVGASVPSLRNGDGARNVGSIFFLGIASVLVRYALRVRRRPVS
jgi:hypothetical protein